MRRLLRRFAVALVVLMFALPALAAPGLHLSWDHCSADGRVANRAFACDTNAGSELLVLSFEPPVRKDDAVGYEIRVHVRSSDNALPEWWRFATGACRVTALTYDLSPAVSGTCGYPYSPSVAGGIASNQVDWFGPGSLRILAAAAVPQTDSFTVAPGEEYFAMALVVRHIRTVGIGACAGCATPLCIGFGDLNIVGRVQSGNVRITNPGPNQGGGPGTVTWQGAYVLQYSSVRDFTSEFVTFACDPDASSPTRPSTWGRVKSLYR